MNVTAVDLNLLKAFEALMAERTVTRAGQRIGLSQPAMSHALVRLRHIFRDDLFVRAPSGMEPTARAHELAPEIEAALNHIRTALSWIGPFGPATTERTFTAGVAEYAEIALVEAVMKAFERQAPRANLRFVAASKDSILRQFDDRTIDVAIAHFKEPPPHLDARLLFTDRLVLIAREAHPALQRPLDMNVYLGLTHALVSPTGVTSGAIDQELAVMGLARRVGLVVATYLALPLALRQTDLVAAVPSRTAMQLTSMAGLTVQDLPFQHTTNVHLVWHRRDEVDAGQCWFRKVLGDVAAAA